MTDIEKLKTQLAIDKFSLDEEVSNQPMQFFSVAEAYEDAVAERDYLKEQLATVEADLDGQTRNKLEKMVDKVTEAMVKSEIQLSKRRQEAYAKYLQAKTAAGKLSALKEAFTSRGHMLRDLASLYVASYFEQTSVQGTSSTDKVQYDKRREQLANARKNRNVR